MKISFFSIWLAAMLVVVLKAFALFGLAYLSFSMQAQASDSSACYNVSDQDARSYCIAKAKREVSACYSIQRADLRSQCLAEVR